MFSCEFCEISKNTFFTEHMKTSGPHEHIWTTASRYSGHKSRPWSDFLSILKFKNR